MVLSDLSVVETWCVCVRKEFSICCFGDLFISEETDLLFPLSLCVCAHTHVYADPHRCMCI